MSRFPVGVSRSTLAIAGAIGRAYLPHITPRQTLRLVGKFLG